MSDGMTSSSYLGGSRNPEEPALADNHAILVVVLAGYHKPPVHRTLFGEGCSRAIHGLLVIEPDLFEVVYEIFGTFDDFALFGVTFLVVVTQWLSFGVLVFLCDRFEKLIVDFLVFPNKRFVICGGTDQ